LTYRNC